jgi:pimeloyl-ACP methyl ester carboxylesterase
MSAMNETGDPAVFIHGFAGDASHWDCGGRPAIWS